VIDGERSVPHPADERPNERRGGDRRVRVDIARLHRLLLLVLAGVLGAAVVVLPAVAGSETGPTVNAESSSSICGVYYPNCWSPAHVEVTSPGTVAFKNSSGYAHGVIWSSVPVTPSCSGVPVGVGESRSSFNGTCSFSQPGTYNFYCSVHGPNMSGTVTVNATGTTTTTSTGTTTTSTATTPTSTTPTSTSTTPGQFPSGSPLLGNPSLRSSQRGAVVRGSLEVSPAGAGDKLQIDLFVKRASLAKTPGRGSGVVRVGRVVRASLSPGRLSFSVPLNAAARRALRRRHRLSLTVRITLTSARGAPLLISRKAILRG
jgi:plastocyanin